MTLPASLLAALPRTGLADNLLIIGGVLLLVAAGALVLVFRKK